MEDTRGEMRSEFVHRVRSKPWITQTTKDMEFGIIGRRPEELVIWRGHLLCRCGETINEICSREKCI